MPNTAMASNACTNIIGNGPTPTSVSAPSSVSLRTSGFAAGFGLQFLRMLLLETARSETSCASEAFHETIAQLQLSMSELSDEKGRALLLRLSRTTLPLHIQSNSRDQLIRAANVATLSSIRNGLAYPWFRLGSSLGDYLYTILATPTERILRGDQLPPPTMLRQALFAIPVGEIERSPTAAALRTGDSWS